ncbi:hypothetical protein KNO34_05795 [Taylorella equigenitalis]|uniref:hypothetical protein n=1 Tax=Taylorella equigenitalis TaxID=29575 RepID=UPI00237CA65F|nr:hypothetical protein [Taylorella equigenitalis]WDU49003.1 hypothetical protein KNO34_05795 [Taylorella equigenitalis]
MKVYYLIPFIFTTLTACQATPESCDPSRELGYFDKLGCSLNGGYDKRIEQKEVKLQNEQIKNKQLNYEKKRLNKKRDATRAERKSKERESIRANKSNRKVQEDLNNKNRIQSGFNERNNGTPVSNSAPSEDNSLKAKRLELEKLQKSNLN